MYVNEGYEDYKYVVSNSDNFLVLTNSRSVNGSWESPDDISVLIQYLNPSDLYYTTTMTFSNTRVFPRVELTNSDWSRADISNVLICSFLIIILTIFVYNILSKIFVRGGFCR